MHISSQQTDKPTHSPLKQSGNDQSDTNFREYCHFLADFVTVIVNVSQCQFRYSQKRYFIMAVMHFIAFSIMRDMLLSHICNIFQDDKGNVWAWIIQRELSRTRDSSLCICQIITRKTFAISWQCSATWFLFKLGATNVFVIYYT